MRIHLKMCTFEQLAQPRGVAVLAFAFATVAVLAAAAGLFSVLTYAVGRRKREFGIRSALGASPRRFKHSSYATALSSR